MKARVDIAAMLIGALLASVAAVADVARDWRQEWPNTDFARHTVALSEIESGGPGKDGIPAIDHPRFVPVSDYRDADGAEPVIGLIVEGDARAYPLRILIWHEIVNDVVGGIPVAVTYCPLCNTSIVFDRRVSGRELDFGTTGKLRHSDLVMYDRQTESWWQQYSGEAIVGELTGTALRMLPSRLESLDEFRARAPKGRVLVPRLPRARKYGNNPYVGYDRSPFPFLFSGKVPKGVAPMMRVVAVDGVAVALPLLREREVVETGSLRMSWTAGQRSALDSSRIDQGRDIGSVVVTRDGEDVPYVVTFAFAFFAFNPEGTLLTAKGPVHGRPQ